MATLQDMQAQDAAFSKQYDAQQAAKAQQDTQAKQSPSYLQRFTTSVGRITSDAIESAVTEAEQWGTAAKRVGQDAAAGAATAVANTMDAVKSMGSPNDPNDPANAPTPVWDHAKSAILDFRDAVAVKDPNIVDGLAQAGAQLAIPFAGYSKALSGLHGIANVVAAGAAVDATALGAHDMRMADLFALGRHTEGKLGDALRVLSPDGSALNAYINFLTDRRDETEAEGRFKNVLDGFGANLIATPLIHAAAVTLKQGTAGVRYAMENGVRNTISDLAAPMKVGPAAQQGKIVFHGTGSDFDEFDTSKIGSGEGNQAFGHGLYFAENPETAQYYRNSIARGSVSNSSPMAHALDAMEATKGDAKRAYTQLTNMAKLAVDPNVAERYTAAAGIVRAGNATARGTIMHVDIPDEHIEKMMHWDQPLSEQPTVKKAFEKYGITDDGKKTAGQAYRELADALQPPEVELPGFPKGWSGMQRGNEGQPAASALLAREGIPGIKYLDQGSRNGGAGTRNIVLFDAKHAKIVKKD